MLVIRNEQMRIFEQSGWARLIESLVDSIEHRWPEEFSSREELRGLVMDSVKRARHHGFNSAEEIELFIELCANEAWDFDENQDFAWMWPFLHDAAISSPKDRLRLLLDYSRHRSNVELYNARLEADFDAAGRDRSGLDPL